MIERPAIEANYWESLAIFWRIFWTSTLFMLSVLLVAGIVLTLVIGQGGAMRLLNQPVVQFVAQQVATAIAIFVFIPLVSRWRYRHFSVVIATNAGTTSKFSLDQRFQVMIFLLWRWIVASLATGFAVAPINIFVGLFGINLAIPIVILALVFGTGPLLARFLIGHPFSDFRLEIQRNNSQEANLDATPAKSV